MKRFYWPARIAVSISEDVFDASVLDSSRMVSIPPVICPSEFLRQDMEMLTLTRFPFEAINAGSLVMGFPVLRL